MSEQNPTPHESAQTRFDRNYITASAIYRSHGVTRAGLLSARRRGLLPDAVHVEGGMCIWERTPALEKALEAWKLMLDVRRNGAKGQAQA
jgi:hypothetical protein